MYAALATLVCLGSAHVNMHPVERVQCQISTGECDQLAAAERSGESHQQQRRVTPFTDPTGPPGHLGAGRLDQSHDVLGQQRVARRSGTVTGDRVFAAQTSGGCAHQCMLRGVAVAARAAMSVADRRDPLGQRRGGIGTAAVAVDGLGGFDEVGRDDIWTCR